MGRLGRGGNRRLEELEHAREAHEPEAAQEVQDRRAAVPAARHDLGCFFGSQEVQKMELKMEIRKRKMDMIQKETF